MYEKEQAREMDNNMNKVPSTHAYTYLILSVELVFLIASTIEINFSVWQYNVTTNIERRK